MVQLGIYYIINKEASARTETFGWFECQSSMLEKLKSGKELGQVMNELTGRTYVQRREGTIGIVIKERLNRKPHSVNLYKTLFH
jgi:non-canonical (house-cleaning) NTP pyrophosphatase